MFSRQARPNEAPDAAKCAPATACTCHGWVLELLDALDATVWDARGGLVANRLFFDTAAALDPRADERRARNYTRPLTRPGELGAAWRQAGLTQVQETLLHIRMDYGSFADFWSPYLGRDGPGAEYVGSLDAAACNHQEAAVRAAYLDGEPDGPRSYAALAWAVRGIAP